MIPIYKPYLPKKSLKYAHDAIDSTWISSHGEYLSIVKDKLKKLAGTDYIILTNNGTSATHLLAIALQYKHPTVRNIIVPSNVYIAAWNMLIINPFYNIIPVDADVNTWNYDLDKLKTAYADNPDDTACLVVHNIGNIMDVPSMKDDFPNWVFLEDNCEGFLGGYSNQPSGSASLASSVSFFGNKSITSGEGGMFCTNDKDLFNYINRVKSHCITEQKFIFDGLGYNYRMTNIQAALLYGQLDILPTIQSKKSKIFEKYKELLSDLVDTGTISLQSSAENTTHSNWMFAIRINNINRTILDKLTLYLYQNDIDTRPMFPPINHHGHFKHFGNKFTTSEELYNQVIILPSYPELSNSEVLYICNKLKTFFK